MISRIFLLTLAVFAALGWGLASADNSNNKPTVLSPLALVPVVKFANKGDDCDESAANKRDGTECKKPKKSKDGKDCDDRRGCDDGNSHGDDKHGD